MRKIPVMLYEKDLEVILKLTSTVSVMLESFQDTELTPADGIALYRKSAMFLSMLNSGIEVEKPIDIDGGLSVF